MEDLEDLLDREEKMRKALEKEIKNRGQEVRGIVREELESVEGVGRTKEGEESGGDGKEIG